MCPKSSNCLKRQLPEKLLHFLAKFTSIHILNFLNFSSILIPKLTRNLTVDTPVIKAVKVLRKSQTLPVILLPEKKVLSERSNRPLTYLSQKMNSPANLHTYLEAHRQKQLRYQNNKKIKATIVNLQVPKS